MSARFRLAARSDHGVPLNYRGKPLYEIDPDTGCWVWLGSTFACGYGRLRRDGKTPNAHVWMYRELRGEIPAGLELDHLCRNRRCVNPDHLEPVTHAENMRRSPVAKLTVGDALTIRASTEQTMHLARRYGVSHTTIRNIRAGTGWTADLPEEQAA